MAESEIGLEPTLLGGRYRLLEMVGSGAMATVHRAHDVVLGRDVAVKTFRSHAPDPRHEERRRGEMQVLARLNHPSLVRLYDAGTDTQEDGTAQVAYLVMEYVDGQDLRHRLFSGPLTHDDVRLLALDLTEALGFVHALGIVHRDIKPANILVPHSGPGRRLPAKLTDFGIARLTDASRMTMTNTTIGTANYLSPEQARGEKVGPASDVYSLGLVLLEALTGRMEFTGGAVEAAVARLLREPRVPDHLGEPWASLLPRMTARDAAARPDAAGVLAALRDGGPSARTPGTAATSVMVDAGSTQALPPRTSADSGPRDLAPTAPTPSGPEETTPRTGVLGTSMDGRQTVAMQSTPLIPELPPEIPEVPARQPSRRPRPEAARRSPSHRRLVWAAIIVGIVSALLVAVPLALTAMVPGRASVPAMPASPTSPATPGLLVPDQATTDQASEPSTPDVPTPTPEPTKAKGKAKK